MMWLQFPFADLGSFVSAGFPLGLVLTAFAFGVRHGFDWDHIAAISDLSGSAESRRRGFSLSMLYAVGHAAVVLAIGVVIVLAGSAIPEGFAQALDQWMGRVVGVTLVALGLWIIVELVRKGRDFRLQSRWMLVLKGTFAGFRRVHRSIDPATRRSARHLEVEHDHEHDHEHGHSDGAHDDVQAHDHDHLDQSGAFDVVEDRPLVGVNAAAESELGADSPRWVSGWFGGRHGGSHSHPHSHSHSHSHSHRHRMSLGDVGGGAAVGIGVLHGVGIESPTQIALFTASAAVGQGVTAFALLMAWVVGLVVANAILAVVAGFGLLQAERYFTVYAAVAVTVGLLSVVMGAALLADVELPLPELN